MQNSFNGSIRFTAFSVCHGYNHTNRHINVTNEWRDHRCSTSAVNETSCQSQPSDYQVWPLSLVVIHAQLILGSGTGKHWCTNGKVHCIVGQMLMSSTADNQPHCGVMNIHQTCWWQPSTLHSAHDNTLSEAAVIILTE